MTISIKADSSKVRTHCRKYEVISLYIDAKHAYPFLLNEAYINLMYIFRRAYWKEVYSFKCTAAPIWIELPLSVIGNAVFFDRIDPV